MDSIDISPPTQFFDKNGLPLPAVPPECIPDIDLLVTEDDTPVDNIYVEMQQRLFTDPLHSSWSAPNNEPFLALANVGFFYNYNRPPLVPDAMLSLGVGLEGDLRKKENRSYFMWIIEKSPDVVIEIVSDHRGEEEDFKFKTYARWGVLYYVIYDPDNILKNGVLRAFSLERRTYKPIDPGFFPDVGLGVKLWTGVYSQYQQEWLRWCGPDGKVIPTGKELADAAVLKAEDERKKAEDERKKAEDERKKAEDERKKAEDERKKAEDERKKAEDERKKAERAEARLLRLEAQLRAQGLEPANGDVQPPPA